MLIGDEIGEAVEQLSSYRSMPPHTEFERAEAGVSPEPVVPAQTPLASQNPSGRKSSARGRIRNDRQIANAASENSGCLSTHDARVEGAPRSYSVGPTISCYPTTPCPTENVTVNDIILNHRRYEDLRRAHQRLNLQCIAMTKMAGHNAATTVWLDPYAAAMEPLVTAIKAQEKTLAKLAKGLPVHNWAASVSGLSDRFLALIVGEAGRPITDYRNPSCLWKRMGMAVIDGQRQRRVIGDAALAHGYVPRRRALMWNIEESILKQQLRKDGNGERIAKGHYGQVYIDRRAQEVANKGEKYSHARAKRYMGKRILRDLWRAWRDAENQNV